MLKKNYKEIKTKSENNIYNCYSIKLTEEEIDKFKMFIFNTISLIFSGKEVNLDVIVYNLYNEIIKEINPKNIFNLELIILKNDDLEIELIEDYV